MLKPEAFNITAVVLLTLATLPTTAGAQDNRDFIFTDEEGHLVLRFIGTQADEWSVNQQAEIQSSQLSTMVHDRLQADSAFDAEPVDEHWAPAMKDSLERYMPGLLQSSNGIKPGRESTGSGFSSVDIECRSYSCRLRFNHSGGERVNEHQKLMESTASTIDDFLAENPDRLEPAYLIAGQYQEPGVPFIKVFLKRSY